MDQLLDYRFKKLKGILEYSYRNVPFYRDRLIAVGCEPGAIKSFKDFSAIPVLEKTDVPRLLKDVSTNSSGRISRRQTAGSSGNPLTVLADPETNAWTYAARRRFQGWLNLEPGDRQARFWGRPLRGSLRKARLKDALLNRVTVDSQGMENERWPTTLEMLHRFKPQYAYGYTSMLLEFAEKLEQAGMTGSEIGLKAAIFTSETCLPFQKTRLTQLLRCPVAAEYGCSEVDIIAFGCKEDRLHINAESIWVEVLDSPDTTNDIGEIVVTDLNNRCMPLLRYRLGDLGRLRDGSSCPCGSPLPVLEEVTGRSQGQFIRTRRGARLHSQTLAYLFEEWSDDGWPVRQFQVIQPRLGELQFRIVPDPKSGFQKEAAMNRLRAEVQALLQEECVVEVELLHETHAERDGKKYRHFISLIEDGGDDRSRTP